MKTAEILGVSVELDEKGRVMCGVDINGDRRIPYEAYRRESGWWNCSRLYTPKQLRRKMTKGTASWDGRIPRDLWLVKDAEDGDEIPFETHKDATEYAASFGGKVIRNKKVWLWK